MKKLLKIIPALVFAACCFMFAAKCLKAGGFTGAIADFPTAIHRAVKGQMQTTTDYLNGEQTEYDESVFTGEYHYYYEKLSDDDKLIYRQIYAMMQKRICRFCQGDVFTDASLHGDSLVTGLHGLLNHLVQLAMVESGNKDSSKSEVRLHSLQCRDKGIEHSHTFQRKKLWCHRNDDFISCEESVCGNDSQRWRTVYENVVIVLLHGFEQSAQQLFSCQEIGQGNLCACHFEGGRNEVEVLPDVLHWQGCAINQRVKDTCLHLIFILLPLHSETSLNELVNGC